MCNQMFAAGQMLLNQLLQSNSSEDGSKTCTYSFNPRRIQTSKRKRKEKEREKERERQYQYIDPLVKRAITEPMDGREREREREEERE